MDKNSNIVLVDRYLPYDQITGILGNHAPIDIYTLSDMVQTDETISSCLGYITSSILARLGGYRNADEEIQAFVNSNFELMEQNLEDIFLGMLDMIWAGFSVSEIVTRNIGNYILLDRVIPIDPRTITFHLIDNYDSPKYGNIDYIYQLHNSSYQAKLPIEKCLVCHNVIPGFAPSPYGASRLIPVHKYWLAKGKNLSAWVQTLERFGSPITRYKIEDDRKKVIVGEGENAHAVPITEFVAEAHQKSKNLSAWIYTEGNEVDFVFPPDVGESFLSAQTYYNSMIMRGMLVPVAMLEYSNSASSSAAEAHFELFLLMIDDLTSRITKAFINQIIRPLVLVNFGPQEQYGYFAVQESKKDLLAWAYAFSQMLATGAVDAHDLEDLNVMRQKMGLQPKEKLPSIDKLAPGSAEKAGIGL